MYLAPPLTDPWEEIDADEYADQELLDGTPLEGWAEIVMPGGMTWYFGIVEPEAQPREDDDDSEDYFAEELEANEAALSAAGVEV